MMRVGHVKAHASRDVERNVECYEENSNDLFLRVLRLLYDICFECSAQTLCLMVTLDPIQGFAELYKIFPREFLGFQV